MRNFRTLRVLAALLMAASIGTSAAYAGAVKPTPPTKPTKPAPPANPTPGGDFVQCMMEGNGIQICLAQAGG